MDKYYVAGAEGQRGPFSLEQLRQQGVTPQTLVWATGMSDWSPAARVEEVRRFLDLPEQAAMPIAGPTPPVPAPYADRPPAPPQPQHYAQGHPSPGYPPPPSYGQYPQQNVSTGPVHVHVVNQMAQSAPMAPVYYMQTKSVGVAFLLTFFFGPLGMLYSTISGGLIMLLLWIVLGTLTLGLALFILYPLSIIWACVAAANSRVVVGGPGYVQQVAR